MVGREKREVGNEKNRDEGEDEEGRFRLDLLLIFFVNGLIFISDFLVAFLKNIV